MSESEKVIKNAFGKRCRHNKFLYDESLNSVECGLCGEQLNPMWVIKQFMNQENRHLMRLHELEGLATEAEKKNKCKCEHCGKMTRVQK